MQAGVYLQDDIRLRKNLTLSPGVRYEAQTHLNDYNNVGPRFGVTWAPFKSGKTTLRGSAGMFYDWLSTGTYEQTLRVDGFRQRELNIINPSYPFPDSIGAIAADEQLPARLRSRHAADDAAERRASTRRSRRRSASSATYARHARRRPAARLNLNAPVNGVRPDAEFANVVEVGSDARSRAQSVSVNSSFSLAAPSPGAPGEAASTGGARRSYVRLLQPRKSENNTDGAFSILPINTPDTEWGPAPWRLAASLNLSVSTRHAQELQLDI